MQAICGASLRKVILPIGALGSAGVWLEMKFADDRDLAVIGISLREPLNQPSLQKEQRDHVARGDPSSGCHPSARSVAARTLVGILRTNPHAKGKSGAMAANAVI